MYAKGLDGRTLTTDSYGLTIGTNNRAWIQDGAQNDSYWSYWHQYVGGSLDFDVDVSGVGCDHAAGVYLVPLDYGSCSWDAKDPGTQPPCARAEIFEANTKALSVAMFACTGGACETTSATKQQTSGSQYGPGASYTINSTQPYHVSTKFYSGLDADGYFTGLEYVETTLSQGTNKVVFRQDDPAYMEAFTQLLYFDSAVAVSNWNAGTTNDLGGSCGSATTASSVKISNWFFTNNDSIYVEPVEPTVVIEGPADNVDDCGESVCAGCSRAHWSNTPSTTYLTCTDYTTYRYTNQCTSADNRSLCGALDLCFWSYPYGDAAKTSSPDYKCRPLPNRLELGTFVYDTKSTICKSGTLK